VAFLILPLFALANTGLRIDANSFISLLHPNSIGIIGGLIFGNIVGINIFTFFAVKTNLCSLPSDLNWRHILSISVLAGIGFTMSIFVSMLAFSNDDVVQQSKIAILFASLVAGVVGYVSLQLTLRNDSLAPF
jgi:NhaA family Na+:H+ antiporter